MIHSKALHIEIMTICFCCFTHLAMPLLQVQMTPQAVEYKVGTTVKHITRGLGKVVDLLPDGRVRVHFANGEDHRYKPSSMHKLTLCQFDASLEV